MTSLVIPCKHYQDGSCRSCTELTLPYAQQVEQKEQALRALLDPFLGECDWQAPCVSALAHFRNKAKMVVSSSVERPILGILPKPFEPQSAVDLCDCPLYPTEFQAIFSELKDFIARAGLVPYNVAKNKGELKYILLTESQKTHKLMLRFVLRSEAKRALIERELSGLLQRLPQLEVVSLNIQPKNAAILEGEQEIFLTPTHFLAEDFNQVPLFIRPQGFFQTNPQVASELYATAAEWLSAWAETHACQEVWDLFCGSGGFGLHVAKALQAKNAVKLTGIEISASAIACAKRSAEQLGLTDVHFQALDVDHFDFENHPIPDVVIVNPPRRGIGEKVAAFLEKLQPKVILYSSCNAQSMAKDFAHLGSYQLKKVQLFDMFPHTSHYEVIGFLQRK